MNNNEGFALVGLLAVIVILGVLSFSLYMGFFSDETSTSHKVMENNMTEGVNDFNERINDWDKAEKMLRKDLD